MPRLVLALAVLLVALSTGARASPAGPEPAMRAEGLSFELFGTTFCYGASNGCDVTFAPEPERESVEPTRPAAAPPDAVRAVTLFGLRLCAAPRSTGPACDVTWVAPPPAAPWRDHPELRIVAALP